MNGVSSLEWLYAAAIFCGFAWFAAKGLWGIKRVSAHHLRTAEFWRALPMVLLTAVMVAGLLWFLLWMLTDGLVPHGLYGIGLGAAALVAMIVAYAIKRKRNG